MEIKKITYRFLSCILLFMTIVLIGGCSDEATNVPWDSYKNQGNDANPTITSITGNPVGWPEPSEGSWAAIDTLTIVGTNFTPDTVNTAVYFNKTKAQIVSVTTTEIKVKAPQIVSDSIHVIVTKSSAEQVATFTYKLKEAIGNLYTLLGNNVEIKAITYDKTGQLYANMIINSVGAGVWKLSKSATGDVIKENVTLKGTETFWSGMKFAGNRLFAAKSAKGVWLLPLDKTAPTNTPWVITPQNINDLDFGLNNNMYAAGAANIYIVDLNTKAITTFTTTIKTAAVRVFNNYVYLAGSKSGIEGVWKFAITGATTLGAEEVVGTLPSSAGKIQGMVINANGDQILTTDAASDPLVVIKNGSVSKLFSGSLPVNSKFITWIPGSQYILYSREYSTTSADGTQIIKLTDLVKVMSFSESAPFIGLQL